MSEIWIESMILQTTIGYCFVIANMLIGLANIRDLNLMKGNLKLVKFHKWFGRVEGIIFYIITFQCLIMFAQKVMANNPDLYQPSGVWAHSWFGGFLAVVLVTIKLLYAKFQKDEIYKYGQILGPIGVIGWSISHWTSLSNFYLFVYPGFSRPVYLVPPNFFWTALIPFLIGTALFLVVLLQTRRDGKEKQRFSFDQIAFILHGITFGYERSAKDLLGKPALYKYVIPRTYEFIEKMMTMSGFDMRELEKMSLNDAMKEFSTMAEKIGMAEKIKIKWESADVFTIESVNCSTARVRSVMDEEELTDAVCPWALFSAAIVNKLTGKELIIEPSTFNEIGAISRLKISEKEE
ncbi:MAG: hypothetical protein GF317_02825 [Candidatus Lokiarchaeota archaeon]|nr:hypothetical protein [Candidatus Lokiarchaeota archaeon]MBD3198840.1 hypothetical protein [Candidatus Lokiarchaeota archaeon]